MWIIIIILSVAALIYIFSGVVKRYNKAERIKVTPDVLLAGGEITEQEGDLSRPGNSFRMAMSWKRKAIDYKQLNQNFNQADYHFSRGNLREAEKGFIKVISLKQDHPEANNKLGIIYMRLQQPKKAEAIFRFLIECYPERPVYQSNLGRALYSQQRLAEAAEAYEEAIRLDDKRTERYLSLGQVYREMKEYRKAVKAFSKVLENDMRNEDLYFTITDLLEEIHAYEEAIAYLTAMQDQFPYNEEAKERIREYRRRLKLSPLSSEQGAVKATKVTEVQKTLFADVSPGENIAQAPVADDQTTDEEHDQKEKHLPRQQLQIEQFEFEE